MGAYQIKFNAPMVPQQLQQQIRQIVEAHEGARLSDASGWECH
jgi:hypothetical protein